MRPKNWHYLYNFTYSRLFSTFSLTAKIVLASRSLAQSKKVCHASLVAQVIDAFGVKLSPSQLCEYPARNGSKQIS